MTGRTPGVPRIDRALRRLISQETARANAAEASAKLRRRRHEREAVDEYLRALRPAIVADTC